VKVVKLSVCIATLNRAHCLDQTLDSIISGASEEVEIVILDGGSVDATEEVVHRHRKSFPRIRYYRQEKPMGVDRDFDTAVRQATGEYCWLLCDDDIMKPGAISKVLSRTGEGHSLIVVNADVWNADYTRCLEDRRLKIAEDRVYPPSGLEDLLINTAEYLTFIGGVVIRRDLWMSRERERYFGTEFIHVGVIFQAPLPGTALAIAEPLISIRYGVAQWTARGFDIWMFRWPELVWSLPGISAEAKYRVTCRAPWGSAKNLLFFRAMGAYTTDVYREKVRPRLAETERAIPLLISLIPGRLLNLLGIAYFFLFHRKALMPLVDLMNSRFCIFGSAEIGKR
jgi:glycosyltransferase involved in cell wall biosynthesis